MYYDLAADTIAGEYDLLRTEEKLERYASILDPRNSYDYTQHNLEQSTCLFWIYENALPMSMAETTAASSSICRLH